MNKNDTTILELHEKLLLTNQDLTNLMKECTNKFNKQKKVNKFLTCCLLLITARAVYKHIRTAEEKGL